MESAPLQLVEEAGHEEVQQHPSADMRLRNAIILHPPGSTLPEGWQLPWLEAGWVVSSSSSCERIPAALQERDASTVLIPPLEKTADPRPRAGATNAPKSVMRSPGATNYGKTACSDVVGGMLRRSDFLAQLATVADSGSNTLSVLMAIHVDQAPNFGAELDRTAVFDLEEGICARIANVLGAQDAITIWLEFGFGVLVQRGSADEICDLATLICTSIAAEPFLVADEPLELTVSVGLALSPSAWPTDPAQAWFSTAHAAQGIASRHGGNRFKGVLSRDFEPMTAERVLIIREWVEEAKAGTNIIVEFQPLMPTGADAGELYSVHAKLRDNRAPLGGVYRREYLRLARDAGSMVMIDRISLFHAFETLEKEHRAGRETRLVVPVEIDTLRGLAWRWLVEELRRRQHLRNRLIIEFDATSALMEKENLMRIVSLRRFGVRVCLCERNEDLAKLSAWSRLPGDFLRLSHAAVQTISDTDFSDAVQGWHARGRQLIVASVSDAASVKRLAALGVDYLRGQVLAATGPRLDYGFVSNS